MGRRGVLLVNLGSPEAPTPPAVRRYLAEFLADPLVVDANPVLWWLVRRFVVLPKRGRASAQLYRRVWTREGSPLLANSRRQVAGLAAELGSAHRVELAMRYGRPSIAEGLSRLLRSGCDDLLVLSMFPQECRATTGTLEREARRAWRALGKEGAPRMVSSYHTHPGYVSSLARLAGEVISRGPVDHVILSFHGLPARRIEQGDPYRDHCEATASALAGALALEPASWTLAFQSRFGRGRWLEPDVVEVAELLATDRKRVVVACPGFTADCLETLEEIAIRLRDRFERAGGAELRVVPCLNDDPQWIRALAGIVRDAFG